VGVTLALIDANIWIAAFAIGIVSFAMSTIGVLVGRAVGAYLGRGAEACGGVLMILIGTHILLDHLGLL
jgi:manganese efflux pump family protein